MAQGNRGFAQGLASTTSATSSTRLPPRTSILGIRGNRLAELAAGTSISRVQELVDPARCRIWEGHNRDYGALTAETCADLIESFKAQGRQEIPAVVRRVQGDPEHDFEVICGARRHWTVGWLRAHDFPDIRFLVEPHELTDEEAFRVSDLENRSRRDLSDYERARDYARAVERYYDGNQQRMADRLEVTKSWLSRYLELARLPAQVLAAFGSPHVIGISHAALLAPLLRVPEQSERILTEAAALQAEQITLVEHHQPQIPPATVARRLVSAANAKMPRIAPSGREHVVRMPDGAIVARGQKGGRGGAVTISVPAPGKYDRAALLAAVEEILDRVAAPGRRPKSGGN
jgi:ParB family chromosome partitioning protein